MILVESCWSGVERPMRMMRASEVLEEPAMLVETAQVFEAIEVEAIDYSLVTDPTVQEEGTTTTEQDVDSTTTEPLATTETSEDLVPLTTEDGSTIQIDDELTEDDIEAKTSTSATTEESGDLSTLLKTITIFLKGHEDLEYFDNYDYESLHVSSGESMWVQQ